MKIHILSFALQLDPRQSFINVPKAEMVFLIAESGGTRGKNELFEGA